MTKAKVAPPVKVASGPKNHSVTVSITSVSEGVTNQEIICKEYAVNPQDLVTKNFVIAAAVVEAVMAAMGTIAGQGFDVPKK